MRIEQAKDPAKPRSGEALAELCEADWHPVYAFIRRKGNDPDKAADLTQGFFTLVIETGALATVSPEKGKFRSFLMAACSHFLSNERLQPSNKAWGRTIPSLDRPAQGRRPAQSRTVSRDDPGTDLSSAVGHHHAGSRSGTAQVGSRIEGEKNALRPDPARPSGRELGPSYAEIAAALGLSESVVKVTVHRYRNRLRELLRDEISRIVDDPAEIDQEIATLLESLRR